MEKKIYRWRGNQKEKKAYETMDCLQEMNYKKNKYAKCQHQTLNIKILFDTFTINIDNHD